MVMSHILLDYISEAFVIRIVNILDVWSSWIFVQANAYILSHIRPSLEHTMRRELGNGGVVLFALLCPLDECHLDQKFDLDH